MRIIEESAWWWANVYGGGMPIHDDTPPMAGFYKRRLVSRGPFAPAHIWIEREEDEDGDIMADDKYGCEVDGTPADANEEWMFLCKYPITREEYEQMMEARYESVG